MFKRLMLFLFGDTRDLRQKQIREVLLAVGIAIILCAIIGAVLYVLNIQGRI
jgi:hypothetical protein